MASPMLRWLTLAAVLAPAVAHAECPTDVRDLPPIGLLGFFTDDPAGPTPTFAASLSAGGAVRVDDANAMADSSTAAGSLGGQISGRRGDWNGCLSGDVLDDPHLGQALAFGMFVVLGLMMLVYVPLQRRTSRWMR